MIRWRVIDIEKRFARNGDDMRLADSKHFRRLETERKFLRSPTENRLPNLAPFLSNRNFGSDCSDLLSRCIFDGNMNIVIRFNSQIENASFATLPLGTRGNLTTEAACRRFGSLTGFDD
jgi:hypothetical protein